MARKASSAALTANQVTANLISGVQEVEFIRRPAIVRLSGSQSLNTAGVNFRLTYGGRLLFNAAVGGQNRTPTFPDDVLGEWPVPAGAQGEFIISETLGGTPTYFYAIDVLYVR
jgi:hypothetical protein